MTISSTTTVREAALALSQATKVFEGLKIDYCCGGEKTLEEACAKAGLEPDNVMQLLAQAEAQAEKVSAPSFQNESLTELITYILDKHHVYTKSEMSRLGELVKKVIGAHGQNHRELQTVSSLFRQLCADLEPHIFKEEQILFPYIQALEKSHVENRPAPFIPFGTVNNPIRVMMMEHDTVGDILRELRRVTSDHTVPQDGCMSYQSLYHGLEAFETDLHQHIHLENNILFPRAIELEESRT
ncbi:MAG TPA: iron-sulfur cluster repair di-iron protein [Pyrinomonadaceae bacterium]|nr:iron-sulfur cluster repair di-iron protein [Pyrinomonadaceae bacterium]